MLHISDELRAAFLNDNVKKNIEIEFEPTEEIIPDDFSKVNFYDKYDNSTSSGQISTGYSSRPANEIIWLTSNNIFPALSSEGGALLHKYQRTTKYVYLDFYLKLQAYDIETPAAVEIYMYMQNSKGISVERVKIAEFEWSDISTTQQHITYLAELNNNPTTYYDLSYFNSDIIIKLIKSSGEYTSSDLVRIDANTCYPAHVQIGDDADAFPYSNDVQVAYQGFDFDDYVVYTEKPDKFSRIDFWNYENPSDTIITNKSLNRGFGFLMLDEHWAINTYKDQANYFKLVAKYKILSFTPDTGVSMPIKYCVFLYFKHKTTGSYSMWQSSYRDFQLNVEETIEFAQYMSVYPNYNFYGLFMYFFKSNGSGGTSYYNSSESASFEYTVDATLNIGTFDDTMPYPDAVQVEYIGGNIEDYIVRPPVGGGFTLDNSDLISESFALTESISGSDKLKFGATEAAICEFESPTIDDKDLFGRYFRPYISCEGINERIPLGRFRVKNVTRRGSHNLITKRIQAYDGIYPLSINGSSWYTNYMGLVYDFDKSFYGVTQTTWTAPRQMFSTLYNVLNSINIELPIENVSQNTVTLYSTSQADGGTIVLKERAGSDYYNSDYVACSIAYGISVSPAKKYRVRIGYNYKIVLDEYFEEVGYRNRFGLYPSRGGVIIAEQDSDGKINMFSVNDGDWFAVGPNASTIQILIPSKYHIWSGDEENPRLREMTVSYPSTIYLDNGDFDLFSSNNEAMRLVYYNWQTYELGQPMSTSYRDIIRSLVEITGYFFRYGRDGNIEFIKGEIAGLYPSNELYPADNLYPRGGSAGNEVLPMGKYRSFECDDKETNHFGRVQILLSSVNENEPSTRNYTGDVTKKNVYVMTDNVFYCASGVSYAMKNDGTDPLPELTTMLSNMYNVISSMYYIPCEVEAYGMPWFECGDRIGLLTDHGGFETFIFKRTLQGIQYLTDDYEALGDENTDSVVDAWN